MRVVERLRRSGYTLFSIDNKTGGAVRPDSDEAWAGVENMIAVPTEQLDERWAEEQPE